MSILGRPAVGEFGRDGRVEVALRELVGRLLPAFDAAFPTAVLHELTAFLTDAVDARSVNLWLADYDVRVLGGLAGPDGTDVGERLLADRSTPAGAAFTDQQPVTVGSLAGAVTVYLPVSLRAERLGVLQVEVVSPVAPDTLDGLGEVALTVAYVLKLAARYTDAFERIRRPQPLSVAAEVQWSLLPALAFGCDEFTVAGRLAPAYRVGGDGYDYCVTPDALWLAVTDAMGHALPASALTAIAVNALRDRRRAGDDLAAQATAAADALAQVFGGDRFVAAVLLTVDLATGRGQMISAGHPSPYLLRAKAPATLLDLPHQLPLGLLTGTGTGYRAAPVTLRTGDRLVFTTDGVLEARCPDGTEFGDRLPHELAATAADSAHQVVEQIHRSLLTTTGGGLRDDATVVALDWRGRSAHHARIQDSPARPDAFQS